TLKGIGVRANERICVNLLNYRTKRVRVHGNTFEAFKGMFEANISLPDYIGLGKSVSKGFGTIRTVFKKPQSKS
ncbi:MAG: CRISPR-associated endonuclease Cas6, partial [Candidatus Diapherotrites archaeon]|nr:CRISPR-associated endonuclease Cas6 [Candidatus Diapherotrites archaeon]